MSVGASQRQLMRQLRFLPVESLSQWMDSASNADLITSLYYGKPLIRAAAARALGTCPDPETDIYLADSLFHEDDRIVITALIEGLGTRQTPAAIRALVNYLEVSRWRHHSNIGTAVKQIPIDRALPTLLELLAEPIPTSKYYSYKYRLLVRLLATAARPDVFDALVQLAKSATRPWLLSELAKAICEFNDPRVLPTIASLLEANIKELSSKIAELMRKMSLPDWMLPVIVRTICNPNAEGTLIQNCVMALGQFKSYDAVVMIDSIRSHIPATRYALETALLTIATPEALVLWILCDAPAQPSLSAEECVLLSDSPALSRSCPIPSNAPALPSLYLLHCAIETLKSREWQSFEAASQIIIEADNPLVFQHLSTHLNTVHREWLLDTVAPLWIIHTLSKADYPAACTVIGLHANLTTVVGLFAIRAIKLLCARYPCAHCNELLQNLAIEDSAKAWRTGIEILAHQELVTISSYPIQRHIPLRHLDSALTLLNE